MRLADRMSMVEESATIGITSIASKLRREGKDVISFGVGEPDFKTPERIIKAAEDALHNGETHYTPSAGIPELREAVAEKLRLENGLDVAAENILVAPGAKHLIFEACMSILNPGDEVLQFTPTWVTYDACVSVAGAKTVWVKRNMGEKIDEDALKEAVSKRTRMIMLDSPNNPAGYVLGQDELRFIRDIAVDNDLIAISDEIYEKIVYDANHISIGSMDDMLDRTITVNGFSKTYAMTGWRLGYAAAPKDIFGAMMKLHQHTVTCATSFAQYGGLVALKGPQDNVMSLVKEFRTRRDMIVKGLNDIGFDCMMPDGAFYVFPDVGQLGFNGSALSEKLLNETYVIVTPGIAFGPGCENRVRISYANSRERIAEGIKRIEKALNK